MTGSFGGDLEMEDQLHNQHDHPMFIGQLRTPNPNIQGLTEVRAWGSQKIDENGARIIEKPDENH